MVKKNNTRRISILMNIILVILLFIILLNFCIHAIRTNSFNHQTYTLSSEDEADEVSVYGRMSGEWPKEDALVDGVTNGGTYEYTITNDSQYQVAYWTMRLNITQECYLNQAWNGKVEIHQNVLAGGEKIETLDLHNFDIDYGALNIEAVGEGKNNLMIHLQEGDYIIYYPIGDGFHEYPLNEHNNAATIGLIFYYNQTFDAPKYEITYQFEKRFFQGVEAVIFIIFGIFWVLVLVVDIAWTIARKKAEKDLLEREAMLKETMGLITSFVDAKDAYTNGHSGRVADYTVQLAQELKMNSRDVRFAYYAAIMHDVGKCYVPDEILKKPGKLTPEEFDLIRMHTTYGGEMLKGIKTIDGISDGAKYHHERYDGTGYPEGLKGEKIPYLGRIISVADAFDAMTTSRCYRSALSKDYVISEIKNNLGIQFDPVIGQAMLDLIYEKKIVIDYWEEDNKEMQ